MKLELLAAVLTVLVSTTLAIPVTTDNGLPGDTTDVAVDCPVRPEVGPVAASLCADVDWLGYCHVFVTCEGSCYDLIDYGVINNFGDGVSSVIFPVGQECKFYSGRQCDYNAGPWDGSFWGQRDVDWFAEGPNDHNPRHPGLNNKIKSFKCSHNKASRKEKREKLDSETIQERTGLAAEVFEKRAVLASAEVAGESPSPFSSSKLEISKLLVPVKPPTDYNIISSPDHLTTTDIARSEAVPHPESVAARSEESTSPDIEADSLTIRTVTTASSVIGQVIPSDDFERFTFTACQERDYRGSCPQWPGLRDGLCMNNALLVTIKSISLLGLQHCVLYKNLDCKGENVIITKSEPRLDYFPNEGGVTAEMEGKIQSVWCCIGEGHGPASCNGSCLCDNGVLIEPGIASRSMS